MSGILANSFNSADVTPVWAEVLVILVRVLIPLKYNHERKTYKKRGLCPLKLKKPPKGLGLDFYDFPSLIDVIPVIVFHCDGNAVCSVASLADKLI